MISYALIAVATACLVLMSSYREIREIHGFIVYIAVALLCWETKYPHPSAITADADMYYGTGRHVVSTNWMVIEDGISIIQSWLDFLRSRHPSYEGAIDSTWYLLESVLSLMITATLPATLLWCLHLIFVSYQRMTNCLADIMGPVSNWLATPNEWSVTGMPGAYPLVDRPIDNQEPGVQDDLDATADPSSSHHSHTMSPEQDQEGVTGPAVPDYPCPSAREHALEVELLEMTLERNIVMRELEQANKEMEAMMAREALSSAAIPTLAFSPVRRVVSIAPLAPVVQHTPTLSVSTAVTMAILLPEISSDPVLSLVPPTTIVAIVPVSPPLPAPTVPVPAISSFEEMLVIFDQPKFDIFRDKPNRSSPSTDHNDEEMDDAPRCGLEEQPAFAASLICVPENHTPAQINAEMESEVSVTVPQQSMILNTGFSPIAGYSAMDVYQSKAANMSEEVYRNDTPAALGVMQRDHALISRIPITELLENTPIPGEPNHPQTPRIHLTALLENTPIPAEPDHPQIPPIPLTTLLENTPHPTQPEIPSHDIKMQVSVIEVSAGQVPAGLTVASPEEVPGSLSQMTTVGESVSQPEIVPGITAPIPATTVPEPSAKSEPGIASGSPRPPAPETPVGPKKPLRRKPKDPNTMFVSRNTVAKRKVNLGAGRKFEYEKEAKSSPSTANPPPRTARDELPPLPATPQPSRNRPRPRPREDEDDPDRTRKTPATTIAVVILSPPQQGPAEIAQRRLFAPRKSRFTAQQVTGAHAAELAGRERLDAALASRRAVEAEREETKEEFDEKLKD
ncbi:predicted protein [Verticillium alfalfae VaMs.102]|uniref:Predicted protein n=1 Tax=Verticillium alfalfae (strain VaMs.102 / ATCC MYA-4576 / FGSC 10136) TaxID=526221 RepID=C9SHA2_VERA1|nr:predicted protein [Verticillium alfalfae VaMs.102]EEY17696.1 predicted protein [Verticillium alfalfae VaMs.102]